MLQPPYPGLTRVCMADDIRTYGWEVGDHTYGRPNVMEKERAHLKIGRFSAMAAVTIILGNHDIRNASSYPFDALRSWWPGMNDTSCHVARPVRIGSDVWMGENSMILPGTTIGDGSVIAGGAVVKGEIPPYAIVAGNPGVIVRYRFPPPVVDRLINTAWWNLADSQINDLLPLIASHDVERLLDVIEALRS